jgi:hypothetical protein
MDWDEGPSQEARERIQRWKTQSGAVQLKEMATLAYEDYLAAADDDPKIAELADFCTLELDIQRTINFETRGLQEYRSGEIDSRTSFTHTFVRSGTLLAGTKTHKNPPHGGSSPVENYWSAWIIFFVPLVQDSI